MSQQIRSILILSPAYLIPHENNCVKVLTDDMSAPVTLATFVVVNVLSWRPDRSNYASKIKIRSYLYACHSVCCITFSQSNSQVGGLEQAVDRCEQFQSNMGEIMVWGPWKSLNCVRFWAQSFIRIHHVQIVFQISVLLWVSEFGKHLSCVTLSSLSELLYPEGLSLGTLISLYCISLCWKWMRTTVSQATLPSNFA